MVLSASIIAAILLSAIQHNLAVTTEECSGTYLPDRVACYDTDGPCDPLPIPDGAFPTAPVNDLGYSIQMVRDSPTTHIYVVTENSYNFLVVLDVPSMHRGGRLVRGLKTGTELDKQRRKMSKRGANKMEKLHSKERPKMENKGRAKPNGKKNSKQGGKNTNGKGMMMSKNKNDKQKSGKGGSRGDQVSVAIIDFPEGNFVKRDDTGAIVGSTVTDAIDEILYDMEGYSKDDIGQVQLILSHNHFDHVGAATITKEHIEDTWGIKDMDVIASASVKEGYERLIELGLFSYRAPIPNVLISEKTTVTVGRNTEIVLMPASAHSLEKRDMIIYIEEDDSEPAILMFVDVVFPKWAPFYSFALTTDLAEFLSIHDTLLEFELRDDGIFVGGHLTQLGSKSDIELSKEWTQAVMQASLEALQSVDIGPIAGASGVFDPASTNLGNQWLLFGDYFAELNRVCSKKVVEEFGCILAAVDITVESACNVAQSFWRIEA